MAETEKLKTLVITDTAGKAKALKKFLSKGSEENLKISSFVKENIQARDRSARVLATLAAAFGGGFTCNANKAETTVGYATMYGDSAGVVSALADLWKYQVYALAYYFNETVYGQIGRAHV